MRVVLVLFLFFVEGLGVSVASPILIEPGMHANFDAQLPGYLVNNSGVTLEELDRGRPQDTFAFSGNLVGYFGLPDENPAKLVVWTTKRGPDYEPKDEDGYVVPPPIVPPPPFIPPPPQEDVPEPRTWLQALGGVALMGTKILWKR